ncbi:MAG: GAF domain-containing protein [Chloroflexota bacterium]
MRNFFRSLNIIHWPMWLKLSVGFLFAIVVPVYLVVTITQGGIQTIGVNNLKAYIEDQSVRQQEVIVNALDEAQQHLKVLLNTRAPRDAILQNLTDQRSFATPDLRNTLQAFMKDTPEFQTIRLLNTGGLILAQVNADHVLASGIDGSDSPAFVQATNASIQKRTQSITISNNPLAVEVTQAVVDDQGKLLGVVIASLNPQDVLINNLTFTSAIYPAYSYLITPGQSPILIAPPGVLEKVTTAAEGSVAVQRANQGLTATDTYSVGKDRSLDVIGHYAPILTPNDPTKVVLFAMVTEVDASTPSLQASSYFSGARIFPVAIGLILVLSLLVVLFNQLITPSLSNLRAAIQAAARGDFEHQVKSASRDDEIGSVGAAFVDMRVQVRHLLDDLEARVAARTRDISATQEISRYAATQHNLQTLLDQVVQLIIERFPNIYHAQIFLLDQEHLYAILRASTGEPGKMLLARGHRLAIGSVSVIGQVIDQKQTIIARDTATSQVHRRNEFLPDTHAELAIPLRVADQIIGALDVQSKYRNAFSEDEVSVLETMADQIAVAIENARLYQESVRRLEDIERANREATISTWREYIYGQRQRQLLSEAGSRTAIDMSDLRQRAIDEGHIVAGEPTDHNSIPVAVPILLRGQILGAVEWELPLDDMSDNKLQLAQELANRLAVSLENARLFEESQRATERERIVNSIAAKLTPQTEVSEILQTAVREVGQALRAPQVSIRLHNANGTNSSNGSNGHNGNGSNGTNGSNGSHD